MALFYFILLCAIAIEEQPRQVETLCDDGFERSDKFSSAFREISRCLNKRLPRAKKLKHYLDCFSHPKYKHCRYIKQNVYEDEMSTRGILDALFPKYISATDIKLLQCIVKRYGCWRCQWILEKYEKKHLCTSS